VVSENRTLVKSQPELWQLLDRPDRLREWSSALLGEATKVEVTENDPEVRLAWKAAGQDEVVRVEVELEQDGWGTNVAITAEPEGSPPTQLEGWLEAVLDELASTAKRPFRGIV
jgi:hypothetical protein